MAKLVLLLYYDNVIQSVGLCDTEIIYDNACRVHEVGKM